MFSGRQVSVTQSTDGIVIVKFQNPPFGFVDDVTEKELVNAIDLIEQDQSSSVVILTGSQAGIFLQHYDTLVLEARARQMKAKGLTFNADHPVPEGGLQRVCRQIENSAKTYIAAINGSAIGCGYELALACDLRIAQAGDYQIGLPEVNMGLLPGVGGTQRLSRLLGTAKALELLLLGDVLSPYDAKAYGLVNDVVKAPVLDIALQLASAISAKPAMARAYIKQLVRRAGDSQSDSDSAARFATERTLFCGLLVSDDTLNRLEAINSGTTSIHGEDLSDAA